MTKMRKIPIPAVVVAVFIVSASLSVGVYSAKYRPNVIRGTGTIRFLDVEEGFYGIVGDDGEHYDPTDLSQEFQVDGLRVRFEAQILEGQFSFHVWGWRVLILRIEGVD